MEFEWQMTNFKKWSLRLKSMMNRVTIYDEPRCSIDRHYFTWVDSGTSSSPPVEVECECGMIKKKARK